MHPITRQRAAYARDFYDPDPRTRALVTAQLTLLRRATTAPPDASKVPTSPSPHGQLIALVEEAVGPLLEQSNGNREGPCPWHTSRSGTCLIVFADGDRWWCRSCRRSGDAVAWLALTEGISFADARRRLGMPSRRRGMRRRPTLSVEVPS